MGKSIICLGRGGLGLAFEECGVVCYDKTEVDVSDILQLNKLFKEVSPKYLINCSGFVGTEKCEEEPDKAFLVNVGGVSNISYMCNRYDCKLIHFSTFYVGSHNTYTRSKVMAENLILGMKIKSLIIRLPWVFGKHTNNFILKAIRGNKVKIYEDELGYLAYDNDIVNWTLENIDEEGLVQLANEGFVNRNEILGFIGSVYETMERKISMPLTAPEPNIVMRSWKEAMRENIDGIRSM